MGVVSGCGLDHQERGYRMRGDTGQYSSEERTFASKGEQ